MENKKLSNGCIIGYGVGSIADATTLNFVLMYGVFYFTTVGGLSPVKAGLIMSIGTIMYAVFALIMGPICDNTKSKYGRRRPYILAAAIALPIMYFFLFNNVNFGETGKFIYYMIFMILYYGVYFLFINPYSALSTEMTLDYDERVKLRVPATIFMNIGNLIGMSLPLIAIGFLTSEGMSEGNAWHYFALFLGIVSMISALVAWRTTRGKELPAEVVFNENEKPENIIKSTLVCFWQMLKLKPFKWSIGFIVAYYASYMVFQSGLVYYVLYSAGLGEEAVSTATLVSVIMGMVMVFFIGWLSNRLDKKIALIICLVIGVIGMFIFYFLGVKSIVALLVLMSVYSIANTGFWFLIYPINADFAEVYEFRYGKRREGTIVSIIGILMSISEALGIQVLTWSLTAIGFNGAAEVQSQATIQGLGIVVIVIPAIAMLISAICLVFFPISKSRYEILLTQVEKKRKGEDTDTTGLERIL